MDLHTPFTGQLSIPDKLLPHGESPVELADGQMVAQISRHMLKWGSFRILDVQGQEVAEGRATGLMRRRYQLAGGGQSLLELSFGWRGVSGRSTVTLPDGTRLTVRGSSFRRRFRILDATGAEIGMIRSAGLVALSRNSYVAMLSQPILSIVQLVGLAHCLRKADKSSRSGNRSSVGGLTRTGPVGGSSLGNIVRNATRNRGSTRSSIASNIARGARSRGRRR